MIKKLVFIALIGTCFGAPPENFADAPYCDDTKCVLPNCRCASTIAPRQVDVTKRPQFVLLTFDDAVTALNYDIYHEIFADKVNPDNCSVKTTYFVSHKYTDYQKVHALYAQGHEIALHSITHQTGLDYWSKASEETLTHEFGDEKTIVTKFANIPALAIQGMRLPYLQLSGDNSFTVGKNIGLNYDCSWPTQTFRKPGMWPYTLDYRSNQDCPIGPCPKSSIPGFWVIPMVDWIDNNNTVCSMVDACVNISDDAQGLMDWFVKNFKTAYEGNRAPFGFYVHHAWFQVNPHRLEAYKMFVQYLSSLKDVYIVTPTYLINWMKNPIPIGSPQWPKCTTVEDPGCQPLTCARAFGSETMYFHICGESCPNTYPWLSNPLGN